MPSCFCRNFVFSGAASVVVVVVGVADGALASVTVVDVVIDVLASDVAAAVVAAGTRSPHK